MKPHIHLSLCRESQRIFDNLNIFFISIQRSDDPSNPQEDPVYSDPLDALEKAEDTRIYNFPDFGDEELGDEPIYEEAKAAQSKGLFLTAVPQPFYVRVPRKKHEYTNCFG